MNFAEARLLKDLARRMAEAEAKIRVLEERLALIEKPSRARATLELKHAQAK